MNEAKIEAPSEGVPACSRTTRAPRTMLDHPRETLIADMVEAMLSGGIPVELVVLAVRTAELARGATDPVAERRRAFDRERKRRASKKGPPTQSEPASPPSELQERKDAAVGRARASNRGTRIPGDWFPDEKALLFAEGKLGSLRAHEEIEKFKDYWQARAGSQALKLDWMATWRTWIRKAEEKSRSGSQLLGVGHEAPRRHFNGNPRGRGLAALAMQRAREAAG